MKLKLYSFILAAVLLTGMAGTVTAAAAGQQGGTTIIKSSGVSDKVDHEEVVEYLSTVQDRHNIKIKDISRFFQADSVDDPVYVLRVLNNTLYKLPKGMLSELVGYYKEEGLPTTVRLGYKDGKNIMDGTFEMTDSGPVITIYHTPMGWAGTKSMEGGYDAYLTTAHEFGHYVQQYLWDVYGKDQLSKEWRQINRGYPYGNWKTGYEAAFTREYAATAYEEDFADIFGYMIVHPDELAQRIKQNPDSVLAKKVSYMERIISKNFTTDLNLSDWKAIYSTPEEQPENPSLLETGEADESTQSVSSGDQKDSEETPDNNKPQNAKDTSGGADQADQPPPVEEKAEPSVNVSQPNSAKKRAGTAL